MKRDLAVKPKNTEVVLKFDVLVLLAIHGRSEGPCSVGLNRDCHLPTQVSAGVVQFLIYEFQSYVFDALSAFK